MNVLMVGDIFGEPGRAALAKLLPRLREQHAIDFCVVNCENAAGGFGITGPMAKQMLEQGADVLTSGNHIWDKKEIIEYITKENLLLRPANFPAGTPGVGHVTVKAGPHRVAVVNLMGRVFMSPTDGVIGVDREIILQRFLTQMPMRFEPAKGPAALHGVVIAIEPETGRASDIRRLRVAA